MSAGKIFYYLNAALITGIAAGSLFFLKPALAFGFFCLAAFFLYRKKRLVFVSLGCLVIAMCGFVFVRHAIDSANTRHEQLTQTHNLEIEGAITDIASSSARRVVRMSTDLGSIRFASFDRSLSEGEHLLIRCKEFSDSFSLQGFARSQDIGFCADHEIISRAEHTKSTFLKMREHLVDIISRALPSPESDLLAGMLVGKQSSFPDDLDQVLRRTGTTHIVVLSGFNITILAFIIHAFFRRFRMSLTTSTVASICVILLFVVLVGFSAPVVRATIAACLVLIARARGRPASAILLLLFSACVMLLHNPLLLGWSLSFQLSYLATFGVLSIDRLSPGFTFIPARLGIRESVRTTFAATVMTAPLIATAFGGVSIVSLLTNAFVLPLVPVIMLCGACVLVFGLFVPWFAFILGAVPFVVLRIVVSFLETVSRFPFSYVEGVSFPSWVSLFVYAGIAWWVTKKERHQKIMNEESTGFRVPAWGLVVIAVLFATVGSWIIFTPVRSAVTVFQFDVGQGDAGLLRTAHGFDMLIDAGPDNSLRTRLGRAMSYTDRHIDVVAISHPHADHIAGVFDLFAHYTIGEIWLTENTEGSVFGKELFEELNKRGIPVKILARGQRFHEGGKEEITIDVLWPPKTGPSSDLNESSEVFRIQAQGFTLLYTGDAGFSTEESLLSDAQLGYVDVLKVGHHGARSASSEEFIRALSPTLALVSVGARNTYGQPDFETVQRFEKFNIPLVRTDLCGTIKIELVRQQKMKVRAACTP